MLSIGELARRTGVKVPTIRYYEQIGLIVPAGRSDGGQRRFDGSALERLAFIRHARDLGLGLDAVRELLDLSSHPEKPCAGADRIARDHLAGVRARIARLRRLEAELERITGQCSGETIGECSVIRSLSEPAADDGTAPR